MLALALLAAALMSAPDAKSEDFYRQLNSGTGEGALFVKLFVDPNGKVEKCEVYYSGVSKAQSAKVCRNAIGLTVSNPAIGPDGKPEYGVLDIGKIVVRTESLGPPTPPKFEAPPDLELSVNTLPDAREKKLRVLSAILVDDHGAIVECQSAKDSPVDYSEVACDQAKKLIARVRTNAAGVPVRYVADFVVDFVKGKPAS